MGIIDQPTGSKENEIRSFLKSWKCSNQMIKDVQALVQGLRQRETGALEPFELYFLGKNMHCK